MNRQLLEDPFIPDQIKHRKGNFNRTLAYIQALAVISRLNDVFDTAWSFEIIEHHILQEEVLVLGRLTAEGITKTQFGSSQIWSYLNCSLRYWFQYVKGLLKERTSIALIFGGAIHKSLERYYLDIMLEKVYPELQPARVQTLSQQACRSV